MGLKGKPKGNSDYDQERTIFPENTPITFTLSEVKIKLIERTYNGKTEAKPTFIMVFKDADNDELVEFVGVPKGLAYNEKATFWKRMGALAGRDINDDNVEFFDVEIPFVDSFEDLLGHLQEIDQKSGKTQTLKVSSFSFDGRELIGQKCQLILSVWKKRGTNDDGGNNIEASLPMSSESSGKKKGGAVIPPPVQAQPTQSAMP